MAIQKIRLPHERDGAEDNIAIEVWVTEDGNLAIAEVILNAEDDEIASNGDLIYLVDEEAVSLYEFLKKNFVDTKTGPAKEAHE